MSEGDTTISTLPQDLEHLHLYEIGEPSPLVLRLIVVEAIAREPIEEKLLDMGPKTTSRPIEVGSDSRVFELVWTNYVSYTVTNESYGLPDAHEPSGFLREYISRSRYRDFVAKATWATDEFPGRLRHWCVVCLNQLVDVVSWVPPVVRRIEEYPLPPAPTPSSRH